MCREGFLVASRPGSRDPLRIVTPERSESGRLKTLRRMALLVGDLLDGKVHDRNTAAQLLDTTPENAARHLDAIFDNLTQVRDRREGRTRKFYVDALAERPPPERPAAIAACFASSLARLFEPSKYGAAMREAVSYVLQAMPDGASFADIDRKFFFLRRGGEAAVERNVAVLDVVVDALLDGRAVELEYRRFDAKITRKVVRPLSLAVYEHQLYLIAYSSKSLPTIYRFARIQSVRAQQDRFEYPPRSTYNPEVLFRSQFGIIVDETKPIANVVVKLAPRWKVYVDDHRWHASQRTTIEGDHVVVQLDVRVCDELKHWILGFGHEAEVIAPSSLRDEIAEALRQAVTLYGHVFVQPEPPRKRKAGPTRKKNGSKKGKAARSARSARSHRP